MRWIVYSFITSQCTNERSKGQSCVDAALSSLLSWFYPLRSLSTLVALKSGLFQVLPAFNSTWIMPTRSGTEHLRKNESRTSSGSVCETEVKYLDLSYQHRKSKDRQGSVHLSLNHSQVSLDESCAETSSTTSGLCLICHQNHYDSEEPFRDTSTAEENRWIECSLCTKWSHLECIRKEQNLPPLIWSSTRGSSLQV